MANPGDFAHTVKQQTDIVRIVGEYIKLKKSGAQNYSGLCPFHSEKTPSFSVHATRQFYHCFGCGASGDVLAFVQKIENISFREAVRAVAQKIGIPLPKQSFSTPAEAREAHLRAALIEINERACAIFEEQLGKPEGTRARKYLTERGLDEEAIRTFRIGYAPDSGFLLRDRLKGDYEEELLKASGLFSWKPNEDAISFRAGPTDKTANEQKPAPLYSKFRARVMFPIANEQGRVIAFTGRILQASEKAGPKYLNSPETRIYSKSHVLYNLDRAKLAIRALDHVILVEGQMDCISVFIAGFHNVIASSGTTLTEHQVRLLARHTHNIIVNFDPDEAGAAAAERSLGMLIAEGFNIRVVSLESGFDPDLLLRRRGPQAYAAALKSSQRYFDYLIDRARTAFPVRSAEGKVQAVNFLLPHLQRVPQRIIRNELTTDIAQKLGIDSAVLRQELRHAASARSVAIKAMPESQITQAERILIRALATTDVRDQGGVSDRCGEDLPPDLRRQAQFTLTSEGLHRGLPTESLLQAMVEADSDLFDPMSLPVSDAERRLLAAAMMQEEEELTPDLLESALAALRRRQLERRRQQIQLEIREAERRNDGANLSHLVLEKIKIDRALAAH